MCRSTTLGWWFRATQEEKYHIAQYLSYASHRNIHRTYANKPGFDSKSLFLTHKYLGETGFAEFACVSPDPKKINLSLIDLAFASVVNLVIFRNSFSLYYLQKITQELKKIYPPIMTKIRFQLSPKPSKVEKEKQEKRVFVPFLARWV